MRRGKNIVKSVWKDDGSRIMLVGQSDHFKDQWPASRNKMQANLVMPGKG